MMIYALFLFFKTYFGTLRLLTVFSIINNTALNVLITSLGWILKRKFGVYENFEKVLQRYYQIAFQKG